MPITSELELQAPDMMHSRFYVELKSNDYPTWERSIREGDSITFLDTETNKFVTGVVHSYHNIDDGSGNAPELNAHFFIRWEDMGKWKIVLQRGLKVRMEVPTEEELKQAPKFCMELIQVEPDTHYNAAQYTHCYKEATEYVHPSGVKRWYCEEHTPKKEEIFKTSPVLDGFTKNPISTEDENKLLDN